jgi:hypothetical protein
MTDGHTWFLAVFAFWSLLYCTSKSDGDPFGDSVGEASLSSRLLSSTATRDKIAHLRSFPDYYLSMPIILIRLSRYIFLEYNYGWTFGMRNFKNIGLDR